MASPLLDGMVAPTMKAPKPKGPSLLESHFPKQDEERDIDDLTAQRNQVFNRALSAFQRLEPVSNDRYTLRLTNVHYKGELKMPTPEEQKQALVKRSTMARPLYGTWELVDNASGKVIDRRNKLVARVPILTDLGTAIYNGVATTTSNQSRLLPGVYVRRQSTGIVEAHINPATRTGRTHHIILDPASSVFYLNVGHAKWPLLPLLKLLGVKESQLREAWGDDLLASNLQRAGRFDLKKLYSRFAQYGAAPPKSDEELKEALKNALTRIQLSPDVTQRVLGRPYSNVTPDTYLDATRKILKIHRGEEEPIDRDNLVFQSVWTPEDMLEEKILRYKQPLYKALYKATLAKSLEKLPTRLMDDAIKDVFSGSSGLSQVIDAINPLQVYEQRVRVTRLGEGGISSVDSIPDEAKGVQGSHFGFIDGILTPESLKAGADLRFTRKARKGRKNKILVPFKNLKTGEIEYLTPQDIYDTPIAFPGKKSRDGDWVYAIWRGKIQDVPISKVKYALPHGEDAFSAMANFVPMKSAVKGQRAVMASRMLTQALPLVNAEAPYVQVGVPDQPGKSFEEIYGTKIMGAIRADEDAEVKKVTQNEIVLRTKSGDKRIPLHRHLPGQSKTGFNQEPVVEPGQIIKKGDLLARSNFTDRDGVSALGVNARVAYLPYRGHSFEDAIVVSESFAKRLTSEHYYQHRLETGQLDKLGRAGFIAAFPKKFNRKQLENIGEDGLIKPGSIVHYGDPLVLATRKRPIKKGHERAKAGQLEDISIIWKHHSPGVVTDSLVGHRGVNVVVRTEMPLDVGDKIAGRHAGKGVVSKIVPDEEMPVDKDGKPFEVLLNDLGVISRVNPAQILEAALGKIAEKTGKRYKIVDFEDIDSLRDFVERELEKNNISPQEDLFDPVTGKKIRSVTTGNRFIMKLHHTAESKGSGRATTGYTSEGTPARGGEEGSKRVALMHLGALLSSGATKVIKDAALIRGQQNLDYWRKFMAGYSPETPDVPLVHRKFVASLKAAGVNLESKGDRWNIMAMTDDSVANLAGARELKNAQTVDWRKGMEPVRGGLFDPDLTGGPHGNRWSFIRLAEPMPNPVMEQGILSLLNLTADQYRAILAGKLKINGKTGPEGLRDALSKINVKNEIELLKTRIPKLPASAKNKAVKKLEYLVGAQNTNIHPKDWIMTKVPVLPPIFRPVSVMQGSDVPLVADANYLYKELFEANELLDDLKDKISDVGDERLAVYDAYKAVAGLGDPIQTETKQRKVKGMLRQVFGSSPKKSMIQQKILGVPVDLVGRAVISPNPELSMDEVAIPEDKAWQIYKPFIIRNLSRSGVAPFLAAEEWEKRTPRARDAMLKAMKSRPVIIDRAPVLHRYGVMAFWPRLTKNHVLEVSPMIVTGFGADFDGDQMNYHVPVSDEAVEEAIQKLLPSKNLISPASFKVHQLPKNEFIAGLYLASKPAKKEPPKLFATKKDAIRAWRRGEISINTPIRILSGDQK